MPEADPPLADNPVHGGEVQEWVNWQSWKDCVPKGTESSNLSLSAMNGRKHPNFERYRGFEQKSYKVCSGCIERKNKKLSKVIWSAPFKNIAKVATVKPKSLTPMLL